MANFFAKLVARVQADTASFQKGMSDAKRSTRSFQSDAMSLTRTLKGLTAGFIGFATVRSGIRQVASAMKELDDVAKQADRLGIASEQMIALNFAAEQAGSSAEGMGKFVEKMLKSVGELGFKTGEAAAAFKRLGIDTQSFIRLGAQDQVLAIAEALRKIPTRGEQLALLTQVGGKSSGELFNLLVGGGPEELSKMFGQAKGAGFLFDRAELAQVEAANDSMNLASRSFKAVFARIGIGLAPVLEAFATMLARIPKGDIVNTIRALFIEGSRFVGGAFDLFRIHIPAAMKVMQIAGFEFAKHIIGAFASITSMWLELAKWTPAGLIAGDKINEMQSALKFATVPIAAYQDVLRSEISTLRKQPKWSDQFAGFFVGLFEQADSAAAERKKTSSRFGAFASEEMAMTQAFVDRIGGMLGGFMERIGSSLWATGKQTAFGLKNAPEPASFGTFGLATADELGVVGNRVRQGGSAARATNRIEENTARMDTKLARLVQIGTALLTGGPLRAGVTAGLTLTR